MLKSKIITLFIFLLFTFLVYNKSNVINKKNNYYLDSCNYYKNEINKLESNFYENICVLDSIKKENNTIINIIKEDSIHLKKDSSYFYKIDSLSSYLIITFNEKKKKSL